MNFIIAGYLIVRNSVTITRESVRARNKINIAYYKFNCLLLIPMHTSRNSEASEFQPFNQSIQPFIIAIMQHIKHDIICMF